MAGREGGRERGGREEGREVLKLTCKAISIF